LASALTPAPEQRRLDPEATRAMLARAGIPMPRQAVAADPEAAAEMATVIGFPVALKALGPSLSHKSEAGGVRLGLADRAAVVEAGRRIQAGITGVDRLLVQAMVTQGIELVAGIKRDPAFGPAVLVGLGGVWVEALDDVSLRLAPLTPADAANMLDQLRGSRLLDGYRGAPAVDRDAIAAVLVALGGLAISEPTIVELDLNPLVAGTEGVMAVDVRVLVGAAAGAPAQRASRDTDVDRVLNPASVVVVGASNDPDKQGSRVLRHLVEQGYRGRIHVVNRNRGEVAGRTAFPSIAALPEVPDLACVVVPAEAVDAVVLDCAGAGVGAAIIFSSGFAEAGAAGVALQESLSAQAAASGVALCGPNTAGVMNDAAAFCAASVRSFDSERVSGGAFALLSQSGAVASSLLGRAWASGVGVSHWVCTGNEADLTISDYVRYLAADPTARVISIFLESAQDGRRFVEACRLARAAGKAVLVYKTGSSATGGRAVGSHTGALAGDDRFYDAAFAAAGAVRVRDIQGLLDASVAFAWQPAPRGASLGVVSTSGGMCSVVADEAERQRLTLPPLVHLAGPIAALIPTFGASLNPVDVTMDFAKRPAMVGDVLEVLLADEAVDIGMVVLTTNADPTATAVAERVIDVARAAEKPVLVTRLGPEHLAPEALARYQAARIPVYPMPERTIRVARAMVEHTTTAP
jgi:acyl-CoA synthetase (NDP forming)